MSERRGAWRSRWAALGAAVAVTLGAGGLVAVNAASSVQSSMVTIDPVRILDTRTDVGLPGPFVSAVSQKLQVTGSTIPAGSTGALLNVTVVQPDAAGFLSVRPGDATGVPSTSSLNFAAGDIVANAVQVGLPTSGAHAGQIDITYDAFGRAGPTTEVLVDAVGYMVPGGAGSIGPVGPAGPKGDTGATGAPGPLSSRCGATLRWDLTICKATTIAVGTHPYGVAFDGSSIWVAQFNTVSKINPTTNTVTATVTVAGYAGSTEVAFDGTNIWVAQSVGVVSRIDPTTNTITAAAGVAARASGIAFDGTNLWVADPSPASQVVKVDPTTTNVTARVGVGMQPSGVAFDGTDIWVTQFGAGTVSKIDPTTNTVTATVTVGSRPSRIAFDGTDIWVTNYSSDTVSKINPTTNTVTATVTVGSGPSGIAFDGNNIWVTNVSSDTVSRLVP